MARSIKTYSLLSLLILSFSTTVHSYPGESWESWLARFFGIALSSPEEPSHEPTSTGRIDLKREASDYIDHLLATANQPYVTQRMINEKKASFIRRITPRIQDMHHLTDIEKVQRIHQEAHAWVLQLIAEQANDYANKHIQRMYQRPPVNPELLKRVNDNAVAKSVTNEMFREAQAKAENSHAGSLKEYVGDPLNKKVGFVVEKEFGVYGSATSSAPVYYPSTPRPSAPPLETPRPNLIHIPPTPLYPDLRPSSHEIYEVYPEFENDERNIDFHRRREQGKLYRDACCIVCLEEYTEIGKRVNLFCGHSICPTCLYQWLYRENKRTCPKCRAEIYEREFPRQVLNPDAN